MQMIMQTIWNGSNMSFLAKEGCTLLSHIISPFVNPRWNDYEYASPDTKKPKPSPFPTVHRTSKFPEL
jgi:hypothetical protein